MVKKYIATGLCPICLQEFTALSQSENVCALHLNWLVTKCVECGQVSFSDCAGFCMRHGRADAVSFTRGSGDHRAQLIAYGLEWW